MVRDSLQRERDGNGRGVRGGVGQRNRRAGGARDAAHLHAQLLQQRHVGRPGGGEAQLALQNAHAGAGVCVEPARDGNLDAACTQAVLQLGHLRAAAAEGQGRGGGRGGVRRGRDGGRDGGQGNPAAARGGLRCLGTRKIRGRRCRDHSVSADESERQRKGDRDGARLPDKGLLLAYGAACTGCVNTRGSFEHAPVTLGAGTDAHNPEIGVGTAFGVLHHPIR